MKRIKKFIRHLLEAYNLLKKYKNDYILYFKSRNKKIHKLLRKYNIRRVKATQLHEWKIWYGCTYYRGYMNTGAEKKKVFVKVMSELMRDCYANEYVVNRYIEKNSEFLSERKPALYLNIEDDDILCLVFSYEEMDPISSPEKIGREIKRAVEEYSRIGLIHTDFGTVNLGAVNGKLFLFDYGTAICPDSEGIRVRNGKAYNHAGFETDLAKSLIDDPDYYYDDVIHLGIKELGLSPNNFIVGKGPVYYARLGDRIVKYNAKQVEENVSCLYKESAVMLNV